MKIYLINGMKESDMLKKRVNGFRIRNGINFKKWATKNMMNT